MRVIAIRDADEQTVNIYGYGTYVGDEPCELAFGLTNPKIVLDDGQIVWGCQCWWGDSERLEREQLCGREVVIVPLE